MLLVAVGAGEGASGRGWILWTVWARGALLEPLRSGSGGVKLLRHFDQAPAEKITLPEWQGARQLRVSTRLQPD